jgi:hypothetical protein
MSNRLCAWTCAGCAVNFVLGIWFAAQLPHVAAHHWLAVNVTYGSLAAIFATISLGLALR